MAKAMRVDIVHLGLIAQPHDQMKQIFASQWSSVAGNEKRFWGLCIGACGEIAPNGFQGASACHDVALFITFAMPNPQSPSLGVIVLQGQRTQLASSHTGIKQCHNDGFIPVSGRTLAPYPAPVPGEPRIGIGGDLQKALDFILGKWNDSPLTVAWCGDVAAYDVENVEFDLGP